MTAPRSKDRRARLVAAVEGGRSRTAFPAVLQPRLHSLELAFPKLTSFLKKAAARTRNDLWQAAGRGIDAVPPGRRSHLLRGGRL